MHYAEGSCTNDSSERITLVQRIITPNPTSSLRPVSSPLEKAREEFAAFLAHNASWSDKVNKEHPEFFPELTKKQYPAILWIGCADSRVPETVILDGLPGDVFTTRNIANQFLPDDTSAQSMLQYAVEIAHVRHIIVVGHSNCGGVEAAYSAAFPHRGHDVSPLTYKRAADLESEPTPVDRWIAPLAQLARAMPELADMPLEKALDKLARANVVRQVDALTRSAVVRHAWSHKRGSKIMLTSVHGCMYHLDTGLLEDLRISKYWSGLSSS
ncbi:hypothetical protein PLICRDRAFT_46217 [Plicaturopsis crispa FD-325 SS-3]|uniref:Carbonic anhydrase n=1 Tax=Plicaturopsis crispa FD-325 SS-3 TaxID=944288 RepID=A0A0C9SKU4_PLICR|nr:hypothetical protein PLICRDRAFT_46217 [Plicaturopsis crispa FD-325 SS-3]